jgi:hypothetical protein
MPLRRLPVGRIAAVAALVVAAWAIARTARAPHWRELAPGAEFAVLRGDPYPGTGSADLAVLRLDPARVRLRVRHYRQTLGGHPLGIADWQRRLGALAVFNAGQYYPDSSYMGLLVSGGRFLSKRPHPAFKAALVAGDGRARVLDLDSEPLDPAAPGWDEVAQSFMLFDAAGDTRVRRSDRVANRTAVAEDGEGRIVVVVSEGGYTLDGFATLLRRLPLGLRLAMSMDGGSEAQMVVAAGRFRYATFGRWPRRGAVDAPGAQVPLPAVIAVSAP